MKIALIIFAIAATSVGGYFYHQKLEADKEIYTMKRLAAAEEKRRQSEIDIARITEEKRLAALKIYNETGLWNKGYFHYSKNDKYDKKFIYAALKSKQKHTGWHRKINFLILPNKKIKIKFNRYEQLSKQGRYFISIYKNGKKIKFPNQNFDHVVGALHLRNTDSHVYLYEKTPNLIFDLLKEGGTFDFKCERMIFMWGEAVYDNEIIEFQLDATNLDKAFKKYLRVPEQCDV